jgi:hypothetical protein
LLTNWKKVCEKRKRTERLLSTTWNEGRRGRDGTVIQITTSRYSTAQQTDRQTSFWRALTYPPGSLPLNVRKVWQCVRWFFRPSRNSQVWLLLLFPKKRKDKTNKNQRRGKDKKEERY